MVGASISDKVVNGSSTSSSIPSWKRKRSSLSSDDRAKKKRSLMLLDSDLLDCPICFEPFTIPIFQCDNNGHLACSSCCPKLSNKCPACASPIGDKRCRPMESVLESAFTPCPNAEMGCTKNVSYGKEPTHVKECSFSLCSCPVLNCPYSGPYKNLSDHYCLTHPDNECSDCFVCGLSFGAQTNISDKILVLWEYKKHLLFTVECFEEPYGLKVSVSCVAPCAAEVGEFSYELSYTVDGHTVSYESPEVKRVLQVSGEAPRENFMLIPRCLLRGDLLKMKLCIKSRS
ncbi:E3 ubiquitin-protein ligase SINA-like 7 [Hirschfeldia incana]|nr:E3 ubiquitin-protein ligase SINA-like 7 [Hirschfeldia incana]